VELFINISLLSLLLATAIGIVVSRDLLVSVMLTGIYGFLSASFFVLMDAVDVAFTEAAVGSGISPLLMLLTLAMVGRYETCQRSYRLPALILVLITGGLLIVGTIDMPAFGTADAPVHQHVAPRYLEASYGEIGIPNVVTSVLASYRAFDTFGEVVVVFAAGIGVMSLLSIGAQPASGPRDDGARHHTILRVVSKILIPPIMLFAFYVQFHGDYGPGGGFQAGVIFAASVILYTLFFGIDLARQVLSENLLRVLAAMGALLYGSVGVVSLLSGGNFLDYNVLLADPIAGQHLGIIVIEAGVGITVASVMVLIFYSFIGQLSNKDSGDTAQ
tara:strand:+ start:9204 stop:10196 length:993 start_codon:yes stop_codon:yes gene_type:complete